MSKQFQRKPSSGSNPKYPFSGAPSLPRILKTSMTTAQVLRIQNFAFHHYGDLGIGMDTGIRPRLVCPTFRQVALKILTEQGVLSKTEPRDAFGNPRARDPLSELDSGKDELDYSEFPDDASSGNFYQFQTRADSELFANIMKRIQANNGDDDDEEDGFEDAEEGNLGAASETVSGGGGRKVGDSQHPSKSSKRETLDSAAEKLGSNIDDNLLSNLNLGAAGMPNIYLKTGESGGGSSYGLQPPKFTNFLKKTIHGVFNSVSQGYAKRMTERHKANISFFGVFRESLDPGVWEEVQKHQAYAIVNANHDGWGLLLLVRTILSVQSTLHINLAKSTAEREYASFKMQSKDTLNDFCIN